MRNWKPGARREDDHGGEAATIEYAMEAPAVKGIILCGHTYCGAMKAVLDPTSLAGC
jgi:carbonic anhydrase